MELTINGRTHQVDVRGGHAGALGAARRGRPDRHEVRLRNGACGACTVQLDGQPIRSCVTPVSAVAGQGDHHDRGDRRDARRQEGAGGVGRRSTCVQCGYCQSGQIMSASALLASNAHPSDADIDAAMSGNICRCGTYGRIRAAIKQAARAPLSGKGA